MSNDKVVEMKAAVETQTYKVWREVKSLTDEYAVVAASSAEEAVVIATRDEAKLNWTETGTVINHESEITDAEEDNKDEEADES